MQIEIMMERERKSQTVIKQLKQENCALKSKNGGISSYETWDWQQITNWILNVDNSRFSKCHSKILGYIIYEKWIWLGIM